MKVIILCGGQGTRLREETEYKPKPMVEIGGIPILVHIMNIYAHYGYKEFVLCLGYKGDMIREYFFNLSRLNDDCEFHLSTGKTSCLNKGLAYDYRVTFVETGQETQSGERIKIASKYIQDDEFMVTYGDGVSNIDIPKLVRFSRTHRKKYNTHAVLSAVHPSSKYGKIHADKNNIIQKFDEKPVLEDYINGGFMVFNREALNYLGDGDMLEDGLKKMTNDKKLSQYCHEGFWHSMDTMKDVIDLNKMWQDGNALWKVWK